MSQTLDEFLAEQKAELDRFETLWREAHDKNPNMFPLVMKDDNEGMWWEQLQNMPSEFNGSYWLPAEEETGC